LLHHAKLLSHGIDEYAATFQLPLEQTDETWTPARIGVISARGVDSSEGVRNLAVMTEPRVKFEV
jgi:hypothetical protein